MSPKVRVFDIFQVSFPELSTEVSLIAYSFMIFNSPSRLPAFGAGIVISVGDHCDGLKSVALILASGILILTVPTPYGSLFLNCLTYQSVLRRLRLTTLISLL